jgi:CubicO group peptidase (beta-lactamase class C family)
MGRLFAVLVAAFVTTMGLMSRPAAQPSEIGESRLAEAIAYNAVTGGTSLIVVQDGRVLAEDYPNGGRRHRASPIASGTKSFAGLLAGIAMQDGLLTLDEPVAATLPEWRDADRKSVTIRDLLTLSSGIRTDAPLAARGLRQSEAIALPMVAARGERFAYGPAPYMIFTEIMMRKLERRGVRLETYLKGRLLTPLRIELDYWAQTPDGAPRLNSGFSLTARDWALVGQAILDGGRIGERQVIAPSVIEAFGTGTAANPAYGLTFWLNRPVPTTLLEAGGPQADSLDFYTDPRARALPPDLLIAAGAGGQRLYIIPSRRMVIVRQQPIRFDRGGTEETDFSDVALLTALLD